MLRLILRWGAMLGACALLLFGWFKLDPPIPVGQFHTLLSDLSPADVEWSGARLEVRLTAEDRQEAVLATAETVRRIRQNDAQPRDLKVTVEDARRQVLYEFEKQNVGTAPLPQAPRVETLDEDMTLFKLKYELEQVLLPCRTETFGRWEGKMVRVTLSPDEDRKAAMALVPLAVQQVNAEGGGIVRLDLYLGDELLYARDLRYGDTFS